MRYLSLLVLALTPTAALAQRDAKVPDPDPEIERKSFIVAPGFEVSLYAADPLLAKPIQMNFDPQGRLWVATSEVYPQIKPGEKANDKIIILEDRDNDGKADKTTVFADGLLIPTGIEPGDGGAYVANSTELVHLSASKPGGKADKKKILLSGFGTEDTHHIIHTFRWGPDGCLYFNQSIYIHSHIETPHGVKRLNAGGIWRYRPETHELDVFARGWINAWGHAFDKYGQSFVTDGAGGEGINHVVPGGYYITSQGPHAGRILHGLNPGSPKYCGLEIISGRHFPDDWQGDLITNDFRGHRVCRFKLSDDGSSYASREMPELIKTSHPAFRPIDVKMGPDGALYIADWYNPIIQHGEVDFRDPRRDKTHGRIWRVTAKGRPLVPKPKLVDATVPELLDRLKDPEAWTRQQARRVLKERGKEKVLPELEKWVEGLDKADPNLERHYLQAVWVIGSVIANNSTDGWVTELELLDKVTTKATSPQVRAAGVRILANQWFGMLARNAGAKKWYLAFLSDPHSLVRLEAVRGLAHIRASEVAYHALQILDKPMDRTLDYALWLTVRELEPYWMPEFKAGKLTFGGDPKKIAFALNAVGTKDAVEPLVALIDSGTVAKENLHGLYLLLARIGGPEELTKVLAYAGGEGKPGEAERAELTRAVEEGIRTRKVPAPKEVLDLTPLLIDEEPIRHPALRIAGLWKLTNHARMLSDVALSTTSSREARRAALDGLVAMGGTLLDTTLLAADNKNFDPALRLDTIIAYASVKLPAAAKSAAGFLAESKPSEDLLDLYSAFVTRRGGAAALAKELAGKKLSPDVAKLGQRALRAAIVKNDGGLGDALTKAGGLAVRKEATPEEVKARVADVMASSDPARGEAVFRRKELQCLACHGIGGAGGQVGPDLTSIGASAPVDYLVESLLLPNKAVKEGFHAMRVVTAEDKVHVGVKVREADGKLVLRTPEDKEVVIPTNDIVERGEAKSLMPEGQVDPLTRQEFADLVRFLSELGKVGAYAPSPARVVRRWQIIEPTPENMYLARRTRLAAAAEPGTAFTWSPAYSRVSGALVLAELPKIIVWNGNDPLAVARFHLDVTTAGKVKLKFNSVEGLMLFVGARPVEPKAETEIDLATGMQPITLVIDRSKRTADVRVELDDIAGSPARAAVVGGK